MMYTLNSCVAVSSCVTLTNIHCRRESLRSNENTYAMNSRLERMTGGISVTRDIVRVTEGADTHPPKSIQFAQAAVRDKSPSPYFSPSLTVTAASGVVARKGGLWD